MDFCDCIGLETPKSPRHRLRIIFMRYFILFFSCSTSFEGRSFFLFFFLPLVVVKRKTKFMCDPTRAFPRANVLRRAPRRTLLKTIPEHETRPFPPATYNLSSGRRREIAEKVFYLFFSSPSYYSGATALFPYSLNKINSPHVSIYD